MATSSRGDVRLQKIKNRNRLDDQGNPRVSYEAACRYCPESFSSGDDQITKDWAAAHKKTGRHIETKAARENAGLGPREMD